MVECKIIKYFVKDRGYFRLVIVVIDSMLGLLLSVTPFSTDTSCWHCHELEGFNTIAIIVMCRV